VAVRAVPQLRGYRASDDLDGHSWGKAVDGRADPARRRGAGGGGPAFTIRRFPVKTRSFSAKIVFVDAAFFYAVLMPETALDLTY
jgi:hypothetical protein